MTMTNDPELYINHFKKVLASIEEDDMTEYDHNIRRFIERNDTDVVDDCKPVPSELRVSTMSAKCKITREIMMERFITHIYNKILEHKDVTPYTYPFVGVKYRDIEINILEKAVKKKKAGKKSFYNQATLIINQGDDDRQQNIKLFNNSSISLTGCKIKADGLNAVKHIIREMKSASDIFECEEDRETISHSDYKITLINSDYCLNYTIDRPKLAELLIDKYNLFVTYTPDIYPGVKVYYYWNPTYKSNKGICKCESKCEDKKKKDLDENSCKRITIAIFQSGKVIITGSNRMRQTKDAYNTLNKIIMNNYNDIRRITIES